MKKTNSLKAIVLSMTMAALLLTDGLYAQERHGGLFGFNGLFSSWNEFEEDIDGMFGLHDRDANFGAGADIGGLTFEQEDPTIDPNAPIGSGIAILVAAGAGYALLKRKEETK